ncbi:MAG: MATE family efflux transporter [Burkholderiales bacterium]|nr:MATE family efflux transporter [Burkholderiales bacterium]
MKQLIRPDVVRLTTPILVEQICINLLSIVSTIMAARLGPEAVSAVAMVESINAVIGSVFSALGVGATVVVAQLLGRGEKTTAARATLQALISAGLIATVFALLLITFRVPVLGYLFPGVDADVMRNMQVYLAVTALSFPLSALTIVGCGAIRGAGDTAATMKVNVLVNIVNVILSYSLIYGVDLPGTSGEKLVPAFGLLGAAYAIVFTRLIGVGYLFFAVLLKGDFLPPRALCRYRFDTHLQAAIFSVGIPVSMESMIFNGGKLIVQIYIAGMGTAAIAANFIAFSIASFINIPGAALAVALTTLVATDAGRGDFSAARRTIWHVMRVGWIAMAIVGTIFFPLAPWLVAQYSQDPAVIELGALLVRMNCLFLVCYPTTFILPNGFRGAGDARFTVLTTFTGMLIFRLVLGYVLGVTLQFGIVGVWCGVIADWFVRSLMYIVRLRGTKWQRTGLAIPPGEKEV